MSNSQKQPDKTKQQQKIKDIVKNATIKLGMLEAGEHWRLR